MLPSGVWGGSPIREATGFATVRLAGAVVLLWTSGLTTGFFTNSATKSCKVACFTVMMRLRAAGGSRLPTESKLRLTPGCGARRKPPASGPDRRCGDPAEAAASADESERVKTPDNTVVKAHRTQAALSRSASRRGLLPVGRGC